MILDTNVLIYLSKFEISPEKAITNHSAISVITKIEALGFGFKNNEEDELLTPICAQLKVIPLTRMP